MIGLVWSELGQSEVLGLIFGKGGDADSQVVQMGLGDLLVQLLGQHVDTDLVLATLGPEFDLGQNLVGEGVAHDEGRMSHGASQINETAFGEEDDVLSVFEGVTVDLGLHVILDGVGVEPGGIDLAIEMSDVADDGILQHHLEVAAFDDAGAAGSGDEDARLLGGLVHGGDLVSFHGGLKGVDGVDLRDQNAGAESTQSLGAAFADISVSGDAGDLAGDHDVRSALDSVDERLPAAVEVVELRLGDGVVDVDGRDLEFALLVELVEIVDPGGSFLGAALDAGQEVGVLGVDEVGQIASIVENHVEGLTVREEDGLLDAPKVLLVGHALPGVDGDTRGGDGGGSVILGGKDIAAGPGDVRAKLNEGFDKDSSLDCHVKTSGDAGPLEGLGGTVLLAELHESGHLVLGHVDDFATPFRQCDVGHLERELLLRSHDE